MGEPWRQNAACGEFFAGSCFSFFATSGVLMSGLFEGLSLKEKICEILKLLKNEFWNVVRVACAGQCSLNGKVDLFQ